MVRQSVSRVAALVLLAGFVLVSSCTPDSSGIKTLPLAPGSAPAKVKITPGGTSLGFIGQTAALTAQVTDLDGNAAGGLRFVWGVAAPGVVTVTQDGIVSATAEGSARVFARVFNLVDTITVTVKRVPAKLTLTESTVLFTELGATRTVGATVVDGGNQALSSDLVVWSVADTSVAKVDQSGVITAADQGSTTVKATAGSVQSSVSVRVATGPSDIDVDPPTIAIDAIGDQVQLSAAVVDAAGDTIEGVPVTYQWGNQAIADVDENGLVTAYAVGSTNVSVFGDTVRVTVPVSVTQTPASVEVTPDGTTLIPGAKLTFSAVVTDRNDNVIPSPKVSWASTDVTVATITTGGVATAVADGATMVIGTAGAVADTVTLMVLDVPVDSVDVAPDSIEIDQGDTQLLSVAFFDADGQELLGPTASWMSGDTEVATVNASGLVTGIGGGEAWIHATADDGADSTHVTVNTVSFFNIEVRYVGTTPSAAILDAFSMAELRWQQMIIGDLANQAVNIAASACGIDHEAVNETVDDLLIYAEVTAIDGSGGVLGQAGPCVLRTANNLAAFGIMQFDEADLDDLLATDDLTETIIHEMGHVLGLGVAAPWEDILVDAGGADPYWPGTLAIVQYDAAGGTATNKVPVANTGGSGTRDAHWRESHMGRELMTGFINANAVNPLSAITLGAMDDMGYEVDYSKADAYTVSAVFRAAPDRLIRLNELPMRPPMRVDRFGRIVR